MATQLKNIVSFTNVAAGATVALPHNLRWSPPGGGDLPQIPDVCIPSRGGFTVHADDTDVTVTNNTGQPRSVDVYAYVWPTPERAFGDQAILELSPRPFVVNLDDAGGGASAIIGFGANNLDTGGDASGSLWPWWDNDAPDAEIGPVEIVAPRDGRLRNLYVRHNAIGGAGSTSYSVTINGVVDPALAVAALDSGAIGQASDLVGSIIVSQGDRIGMIATNAEGGGGGGVAVTASMIFDD